MANRDTQRPTIARIASIASVSRGTVDRALHDRSGVKPEVAEMIRRIADEIGYVPYKSGRALSFSGKPKRIGVILPTSNREYFDAVQKGVHRMAEEANTMAITVEVRRIDCDNETEVVRTVKELRSGGIAGLAIASLDTTAVREAIVGCRDCDIPVVTVNSDISGIDRLCFVGQDLIRSGAVAAEILSKVIRRAGRVLSITGNLNFQAHKDRIVGFKKGLQNWNASLGVDVREGFGTYAGTMACLEQGFQKAKDDGAKITGIYMATGINEACFDFVRRQGLVGEVRIVTNDETVATRRALREGIADFTICQDPNFQGYIPIKVISEYLLSNRRPDSDWHQSPIRIVGATTQGYGDGTHAVDSWVSEKEFDRGLR